MTDAIKLNNPHAKMVPGEYYGLVVKDPISPQYADDSPYDVIYNIDLIRFDLPDRMRYIKAVSETEYVFEHTDPGVTHRVSDIRGLSVRFDRQVPRRDMDGLYTSDPFAGDDTTAVKKQLAKNKQNRAAAKKKEEEDLNLA